MSATNPTTTADSDRETGTSSSEEAAGASEAAPSFKDDRMESAYYWAAQARAFMHKHTAGLSDQFHVEVVAGKPIIVTSLDFPAFEALESAWIDEGFPTEEGNFSTQPAWNRRELDDEVRYFIEPSSDRLKMPFVPLSEIDKSDFAHGN